ncbi:MAG: copper resistance protein CopC [Burkholderiales bacterium]|nr:copper resistance protein CopC [Burkholderiales bacterium]MDE2275274.1 copper resistance protein CopC [Burkholderiales bacterium]
MIRSIRFRSTAAALATALAALWASPAAHAHARVQTSTPADGATLATAPSALHIRFNEPIEAAVSRVTLLGPAGAAVATSPAQGDPADANALSLPLPRLAAGSYRAQWVTMGRDGHRMTGTLHFTVK